MDDVKITKVVYEYGLKNGKVFFVSNRDYQIYEIVIDWKGVVKDLKDQKKEENTFPTSLF